MSSNFMLEVFDEIEKDAIVNGTFSSLNGKVVLVDFWTYSCVNCLRTLPFIKKLKSLFPPDRLEVVGIHTPEYDFEHDPGNVLNAIKRLKISYPVILDNDFYIWSYFNNQYWPAHYIFDQSGELAMESFGEGGEEEMVETIERLLNMKVEFKPYWEAPSTESVAEEIYLGQLRGTVYSKKVRSEDNCDYFALPGVLEANKVFLEGSWKISDEYAEAAGDQSVLHLRCSAREVNIVVDPGRSKTIEFDVDGVQTKIEVDAPDLYNLVKDGKLNVKSLKIRVPEGSRVYSFTFG